MADSRAALKQKGRRVAGRVPFGYRTDVAKQLVVHEGEATVVRRLFALAAAGTRPQEIADQFNLDRVLGPGAGTAKWTARQVLKMLSNPIYRGSIHDGSRTLPGVHEGIVAPAVFEQVQQAIASRRSRAPGRTGAAIDWPLRGLLICGSCGRAMSPSISGYKNFQYRYYRCRSRASGRQPCADVGISAFEIEEFVRETIASADHSQNFVAAWSLLDKHQQVKALKSVLQEVRFDPKGETISLSLHNDAVDRLRRRRN
jgi:site-specific DNA recombinase